MLFLPDSFILSFTGYGVSKAASFASMLRTYVASKPGVVPECSEEIMKKLEKVW